MRYFTCFAFLLGGDGEKKIMPPHTFTHQAATDNSKNLFRDRRRELHVGKKRMFLFWEFSI